MTERLLPLGTHCLAAGEYRSFEARPSVDCVPLYLIASSDAMPCLMVTDLSVGGVQQLAGGAVVSLSQLQNYYLTALGYMGTCRADSVLRVVLHNHTERSVETGLCWLVRVRVIHVERNQAR